MKTTAAIMLGSCLTLSTLAQERSPQDLIAATSFRVPIHTNPAAADATEYGWWAAGPGFKVSFHDGFVFHPHMGSAKAGRPVRWSTEAITIGGLPLIGSYQDASHWRDQWRYEYRWPLVTEAYDVRHDGVEQTFVVAQRPSRSGDLVVVGRVDTQLTVNAMAAPAHAPLAFCDETGAEVVRYGEAFAVDARGKRLELRTSWVDGRVLLTVPRDWMDDATFPVVVDPLTSPRVIAHGDTTNLHIGYEHESTSGNVMVLYTMRYAQSDWDTFAFLCDSDFQNPALVHAEISASWNVWAADVVYTGGSDRWVIACSSRDAAFQTPIERRFVLHQRGNRQLNVGIPVALPREGSELFDGDFALGGSENGTSVLCAYHSHVGSTRTLWSTVLDTFTRRLRPRQPVSSMSSQYPGEIDVSKSNSDLDSSWLVVWNRWEGTIPSLQAAIYAARIDSTLAGTASAILVAGGQGRSHFYPRVDGRNGRYLLAMSDDNLFLARTLTMRLDWPNTSATPTRIGPQVNLVSANGPPASVAYDHVTQSHWCVTTLMFSAGSEACRVGFSGARTELVTLAPVGPEPRSWGPPVVTFRPLPGEFLIAHVAHVTTPPRLQGVRMQYSPDALVVDYGTACGRTLQTSSPPPYAGSEYFTMRANGLPATTPVALLLSASQAALPIGGGCFLNVGAIAIAIPLNSARGGVGQQLSLPDRPLLLGDLFAQWAYLDGAALATSRGLRVQVR